MFILKLFKPSFFDADRKLTSKETAGWSFVCSYIVLLSIAQTHSFGWQKWIFIIGGFGLAMSIGNGDPKDESPQDCVAYPTIIISYILFIIFILTTELPKIVH
jgi:hypothetical protein